MIFYVLLRSVLPLDEEQDRLPIPLEHLHFTFLTFTWEHRRVNIHTTVVPLRLYHKYTTKFHSSMATIILMVPKTGYDHQTWSTSQSTRPCIGVQWRTKARIVRLVPFLDNVRFAHGGIKELRCGIRYTLTTGPFSPPWADVCCRKDQDEPCWLLSVMYTLNQSMDVKTEMWVMFVGRIPSFY